MYVCVRDTHTYSVYRNQFPIYVFENKQKKNRSVWMKFYFREKNEINMWKRKRVWVSLWKEKVFGYFLFKAQKKTNNQCHKCSFWKRVIYWHRNWKYVIITTTINIYFLLFALFSLYTIHQYNTKLK